MGKNQINPDTDSRNFLLKMFKFLRLILFFIFLSVFMISCEKSDSASGGANLKNNNILRFDVNASITSLTPSDVFASGSNHIFPLLYGYLFVPNADGKLQPDLAVNWAYDSTSFTWTIQLRKDVRFHNNHPVTLKDIQYSLENHLKKLSPSLFFLIDRIWLVSDTEISVRLTKDDPMFPNKIWDAEIVPKPLNNNNEFDNHPIGSGPFKFKYRKGEKEVVLEANEDYYNGRPSLDQIVFYFQPDKEKSWARLLSGVTDIVQEITPENYEMMQHYENRFYFDRYTLPYYRILLYNTNDPLFSDPKVRLALTYAIDREYIVKKILRAYGKIASGPMGADSCFHNPEVKPFPHNPQKGLSLLQDSGWAYEKNTCYLYKGGKPFQFTIYVFNESQIDKKVARYIQICLNDIGVRVDLQALEHRDLVRKFVSNNQFQAVLADFRGADRNPEFLKQQWSTYLSRCSVAGCFEHPNVTRLINHVLEENDPLKQKQLFYEIDALIASLQPGSFLFHKTAIDVMSRRFHLPTPFTLTQEGIYQLRYASINREKTMVNLSR
jgi:peptide/nickel transport system substrate-binding protein